MKTIANLDNLQSAQLSLQTGECFQGTMPKSQNGPYYGEVVFNTGMTGYVETLTDPSYAGQILCFSYPLIGNYGVTDPSTWESKNIQVAGVIFSELTLHSSHYAASDTLYQWLLKEKIPFISGVDTRALIHRLRNTGVVMGAITASRNPPLEFPNWDCINWVSKVSTTSTHYYEPSEQLEHPKTIIAVDCGLKNNILRCLKQFPWRIKRVPFDYDYTQEDYDGLFLSNGPGDPVLCTKTINILKKAFEKPKPIFGICLGAQLMALAAGAKTVKLPFGHRAQNQPCLYLPEDRAYLTSQNHGYAIDEKSLLPDWQVLFRNLNDQTVAGIAHRDLPFFSVQFHPEAAPGPIDTQWLFKKFWEAVNLAAHRT